MIGQTKLLDKIDKLTTNFPRFVMLVGGRGSGKKLICNEIAKKLGYPLVSMGTGVDEVREVIQNSYTNTEPIVYAIPDTDKMSVSAKNALLKITEEPPQKAYFVLTLTDSANTLNTLKSRACMLNMDNYTPEELYSYLSSKYDISSLEEEDIKFIINVAIVPEQVDIMMSYDIVEFIEFVEKVVENLHVVSSANAFKIESKLALKKDEEKWNLIIFLQALRYLYLENYYRKQEVNYFKMFQCVSKTITEINTKNSVNLQYTLDECILQLRQCWR